MLLSDNGPCYVSGELKAWLKNQNMEHTRGALYHPQTQGKIERYHRSMKNVVKLESYYYPRELEQAITEWVEHYNHERYYESLDNVTPADVYEGRRKRYLINVGGEVPSADSAKSTQPAISSLDWRSNWQKSVS
jgi:putative transposase